MEIVKLEVGQLKTNCYFVINNNNCLIIDPGDEGEFILEELQRKRLNPLGLLATHGHFDHLMAVGEIQKSFDVPLYINKNDFFLVKRIKETAEYFLGYKQFILPIEKIKGFNIEDSLKIENWKLKIIDTPGHTPGSVCYFFEKDRILFSGDTLFKGNIGRYDFSYSSYNDLRKSVKRLLKLNEKTIIYPGHGEQSIIREERKHFVSF